MAPLSLSFDVRRCKPELICPAKPTPNEFKELSDIDDQQWLRFHISWIFFYKHDESMIGRDPVQVIREGIAQALVYYYPFAGRLREMEERKLVVECTGEGVVFIEADADVKLEQFGNTLQSPVPCFEELLFDVPGSGELFDSPLLLVQVTRLKCGSFIIALRYNHTMADGFGLLLFLKSVGEMARGATSPSTPPVWDRHLLNARVPPQVTCNHREYEEVEETTTTFDDNLVHRSFFFSSAEISAIRNHISPHLRCSTFEVLAACMWRCRTLALNPNPNEEMRLFFAVNARSKFNPPLPNGYYGNVVAMPVAVTTAGELRSKPLGFALELIRKVKAEVTEEYMHSLADLMVVKDKPHMNLMGNYTVSDATRVGFSDVDFGWGKLVYGGPAQNGYLDRFTSFFTSSRNREGEEGIVVSICLPAVTMVTFVEVLNDILIGKETKTAKHFIKSSI